MLIGIKILLWKTSSITGVLVYLFVTSSWLCSIHPRPHFWLFMLSRQYMTIKHLNFLYWCIAWICHKMTMPTEVNQGNRRITFKAILHLVWSPIWKTRSSSQKSILFRQWLALIFLSGFWLCVKPAPRDASGCLVWRSSGPLHSKQGLVMFWKNCSELEPRRWPTLWGFYVVVPWSP